MSKTSTKQMLESVKETESNLGELCMLKNNVNNKKENEYFALKKTPHNENLKNNKSTYIDEDDLIKIQRSNNINHNILKSKFDNSSSKNRSNINSDNVYSQSLEFFDGTSAYGIRRLNDNKLATSFINKSFAEEDENSNMNKLDTNKFTIFGPKIKDLSYLSNSNTHITSFNNSSQFLNSHLKNRPEKIKTKPNLYKEFSDRLYDRNFKVNSSNKIFNSNKTNGKVVKKVRNHSKLTREQIEKEFSKFTLEFSRRLDHLYLDSSAFSSESNSSAELDPDKNQHPFPSFKSSINKISPHPSTYSSLIYNNKIQFAKEKTLNDNLSSLRTKKTEEVWLI